VDTIYWAENENKRKFGAETLASAELGKHKQHIH
jgi:hypothetical protein